MIALDCKVLEADFRQCLYTWCCMASSMGGCIASFGVC